MSICYSALVGWVFVILHATGSAEYVYEDGHRTEEIHLDALYNQHEETNFKCSSPGLFPNAEDTTCETYFSCEKLSDGQFNKQLLKCVNSTFCSLTASCFASTCPCHPDTVTEYKANSKKLHPCFSSPTNFTCYDTGRFPDFGDVTCKTYFLCSHLHNGTFLKTKYKCINSVFDPEIERCSLDYICPCNSISPTTEAPTTTTQIGSETTSSCAGPHTDFECKTVGRFPDPSDATCRGYFLCSRLGNGTYIKTGYECKFSVFNPLIQQCGTGYICPCSATTELSTSVGNITTLPTISEASSLATTVLPGCSIANFTEYKCREVGRFPDLADLTCRAYFLCSKLYNGTIIKTRYRCPSISIFYPPLEQCSTMHSCPCATLAPTSPPSHTSPLTPIEETSTASISSSSIRIPDCDTAADSFECSVEGRFPDLTDFTCTAYFLCSHLHNGSFIQTRYRCPKTSTFYPLLERCSVTYSCPCSTSSWSTWFTSTTMMTNKGDELTTTLKPSTSSCGIGASEFQCVAQGRFADLSDISCRGYFLCTLLHNGTFLRTPYMCLNSSFNPLTHRCSSTYICPCSADYTTLDQPAHSEGFSTAPPTTSYTCAPPISSNNNFKCSLVGRFPDYTDSSCKRYYLCSKLRNGTFVKTLYNCPSSSCIDSQSQRCSSTCNCPCAEHTV